MACELPRHELCIAYRILPLEILRAILVPLSPKHTERPCDYHCIGVGNLYHWSCCILEIVYFVARLALTGLSRLDRSFITNTATPSRAGWTTIRVCYHSISAVVG